MTKQNRFCLWLLRKGADATLNEVTGTTCPCMTWRDADNPEYSREWHRLYPSAEDCGGTGLISRTTTSTSIKGMAYLIQTATAMGLLTKEQAEAIGELQETDILWTGTANASTGDFVDLSSLVELRDSITYNSTTYRVRHTFDMAWGNETTVGQIAILKRDA